MSFVGSMLSNGSGAGYQGQTAPADNLVSQEAGQGAVTKSNTAANQQQAFTNQLTGAQGLGNQQNVFAQQQALANQLQGQVNGNGPNPVQAQLAQNTAQNIAAQSALAASQRGTGANVGLMSRQVAQQGAATQQQAAGQAATLGAQQQISAEQQLAAQQQAMQGVAGQQVAQQQQGLSVNNATAQGYQGQILGAIGAQNANATNAQNNVNTTSAGIAQGNQASQQGLLGAAGAFGEAVGPKIASLFADGGAVQAPSIFENGAQPTSPQPLAGPKSNVAKYLNAGSNSSFANQAAEFGSKLGSGLASLFGPPSSAPQPVTATADFSNTPSLLNDTATMAGGADSMSPGLMMAARGGKVPAMVSPGEVYIPPEGVKQVAKGKDPIQAGVKVPGKAKVKGDSLKNDTVPTTLDEGGIVLPKSVMEAKNPHWAAHKFVSGIMAKQGLKARR